VTGFGFSGVGCVESRSPSSVLVWLWGFTNCASLRLLDMTRNAAHIRTFSLGAWSASYGFVGLRQTLYGMPPTAPTPSSSN
jgi:hypothetical protein